MVILVPRLWRNAFMMFLRELFFRLSFFTGEKECAFFTVRICDD